MKIYFRGKCNNNCLFCQKNKIEEVSYNSLKRQIEDFDPCKSSRIIFTGVEPTLNKNICELLMMARKPGIEVRQLNTNARMLSNLVFSKKILAAGANYFKISLHGHNAKLHDDITRSKGSFKETIKGIKNLIKLGQREYIVLSIVVNALNYGFLVNILNLAKQLKIKKIQLTIVKTNNCTLLPPLEKVARSVTWLRERYLFDLYIKVEGFPYCLIPAPETLFLKDEVRENYIFLDNCKECKYNSICRGVLKGYIENALVPDIKSIPDLPVEVMIEVESRCNFKCIFCFNRISFASQGFGIHKLESGYIKKIIDNIKKSGVPTVRFTGGEPMLRDDFFELIKYAKSKGLQVRLNTNGSLVESREMAKEMVRYLDYVLFAMHAYNPKDDERITGFTDSFEKKIRAMKWFKDAGIKILRVNTIATLDNIKNLGKFYKLFKKLRVDRWAVNRLIPLSANDLPWGGKETALLIKKLLKIKKDNMQRRIPMWIHIVNAIPLCAGDPIEVSAISSGGRAVDGHERFAIDPRKFAKPIYYMDENIGDPLNILECWNHPFMKSLRNYQMLPDECKKCFLLDRCKGGNRFCAWIANKNYCGADPLMDCSKIKSYIW